MLHNGIRPLGRAGAKVVVGVAANNHVNALNLAGKFLILGQTQVGDKDNMAYALLFQFIHCLFERGFAFVKPRFRACGRKRTHTWVGKANNTHLYTAHFLDNPGLVGRSPQRAAGACIQVGGQHRVGLRLHKASRGFAAVVKFVVAQRHGVVGQQGVYVGQHGPLVGRKKQGSLKLVASVNSQHIVVLGAGALHGGGKAGQTACTAL